MLQRDRQRQRERGTAGGGGVAFTAEYLVVAGGGGGANGHGGGGGGGAGGYLTAADFSITLGSPYTVTVGAGGNGAPSGASPISGSNGGDSSVFGFTSLGGGAGGATNGISGGSGGGATTGTGGAGTSGQGNNGGNGVFSSPAYGGGGGGGAGQTGSTGTNINGGDGGDGLSSVITGVNTFRAGGGGGGTNQTGYPEGSGGLGGGGAGGEQAVGSNGVTNTGGGGGGGGSGYNPGGAGGSGVVIIRVPSTVVAEFSAGVVYNYIPLDDFNVYEITAAGVSDTVTFSQGAVTTVGESLRFNDDDSAYLTRTPASAGDRKTWTWSAWVKRGNLGGNKILLTSITGTTFTNIQLLNDELVYLDYAGTPQAGAETSALFRDPSAWYHIVVAVDTTQAVDSERLKFYVNGKSYSYVTRSGYPSAAPALNYSTMINNTLQHYIGGNSDYFDGYMSDVYFIDGEALDPSRFGKQDADGIWQPITYTGSYGTNGFHLDFANRKYDGSSASLNNLGLDVSGNGNNWTASGLTTYRDGLGDYVANTTLSGTTYGDRTVTQLFNGIAVDNNDNFAPFNCLEFNAQPGSVTFSPAIVATSSIKMWVASYYGGDRTVKINGTNFTFTGTSQYNTPATLYTLPVTTLTSIEVDTAGANDTRFYGIVVDDVLLVDQYADVVSNEDSVDDTPSVNYATLNPLDWNITYLADGNLYTYNTLTAWQLGRGNFGVSSGKWYWETTGATTNVMVGIATSKASLGSYVGGDAHGWGYFSQNGNKYNNATLAPYGATYSGTDVIGVAFDADNGTLEFYKNGTSQGTAFTGLTDGPYFPAVSVYNSAVRHNFGQTPFAHTPPTGFQALNSSNLPAPTITDGKAYFDTALYTGNGTTQAIGGLEFSPDFVWIKNRSVGGTQHLWYDTIRGATNTLFSSSTSSEYSFSGLTSFDANGFTVGSQFPGNGAGNGIAAWTWNAGGNTVTNTDGTITSQVRANTDSGFSIITYTGTGANNSFGHGLTTKPDLFIVKARTAAPNQDWWVFTDIINGSTNYLKLNTAGVAFSGTETWDDSVINVVAAASINYGSVNYVSYAFHSVDGFSKFGTYTGNGSADGPFIYTGFRPAFIIMKSNTNGYYWVMKDNKRAAAYNPATGNLYPNDLLLEDTAATAYVDLLANGFKLRGNYAGTNGSGVGYIFMAFAENPFKTARAR